MSEKIDTKKSVQGNPLEITRTFKVKREVLFDALLDGDKIKQWWGPKGFTSPVFKSEARVGGKYLGCMKSPQGKEMWSTGTFIEIDRPERLKFSDSFADKNGKVVPATYYNMSEDFPMECVIDFSFGRQDAGTRLTLKHYGIPQEEVKDCIQGWQESFDKLQALVENSSEFQASKSQGSSTFGSPNLSV